MVTLSIHRLLRPTLVLAQFCALFPVQGVWAQDSSKLRFKWCTVSMVYMLVVWIGLIFIMCRTWTIVHFREPNGNLSAISNSTLMRWAVPPLFIYTLFLQLSYKWPQFVQMWETVEKRLILQRHNKIVFCKICLFTVVFAALRFVFFAESYFVTGVRITQCVELSSIGEFVRTLFHVRFPQVWMVTQPSYWKYCLLAFLELTSSWSWLCCNLLILAFSLIIIDKFKTFNRHLKHSKSNVSSPTFWKIMRKEYSSLYQLTQITDALLSPMVFATVTLETMNVTLFIYLGLTHAYTMLSYIYFGIFFISYLGVDSMTLIAMAAIFDESRKSLTVLHQVPTLYYTHEAKRLHTHIVRSTIALTGCKFFIVTQTAILSIVSALVTYEVLLVQLGDHEPEPSEESAASSSTNSTEDYCSWIQNYLKIN